MKLDCAEFYSKEPTEEMIVDLVRNNEKRGEFMILEADDGESFVQIAGEYDAANPDACVFTLEYREAGKSAPLYHAVNDVTAAEATEAFLSEFRGDRSWRVRHEWDVDKSYGSSSGKAGGSSLVKKLLYSVPIAFAFAYVGHAAYLWKQYGPPTGFCTKCFIYWGKHRISGGNTHWCEHTPLHWSVSGKPPAKVIPHFARFIAQIWQVHPFGEGNTRTTAVFAIKYLRSLGYHATNNMFKENSWYFRNALVRANYADYPRGVKREWGYLEAFFRNLLLGEKNELKSRYLLIGIDRPPPRFGEGDAVKVVRKSGKKKR